MSLTVRYVGSLLLSVVALACQRSVAPVLPEIPEPDLTHLEPQVRELLRRARAAVLADPRSAAAWGEFGIVLDAHILSDPAEASYRRAHELAPEDFRWVYLLAIVREINGADTRTVIELFDLAARSRPDFAPIPIRLGDALWRRGEYDDAQRRLERAIELAPESALAWRRLGQLALAAGRPAEAVPRLERAIELAPKDLAAHTALAQALQRIGRADQARETLERARGLEPVNVIDDPVHDRLVRMRNVTTARLFPVAVERIQRGDATGAIGDLEIVLAARPGTASVHYWLGAAHRQLGHGAEAQDHLERALALDPRMNAARLQLADLLAGQGRLGEAVEHYALALRYAPDDTAVGARLEQLRAAQRAAASGRALTAVSSSNQ